MIKQNQNPETHKEPQKISENSAEESISSNLREIGGDLSSMWEVMSKSFVGNKRTMEDMTLQYEKSCDQLIIHSVKNEGLLYVSGRISFVQLDETLFECIGEFYFQNSLKKWIVKSASSGKLKITRQLLPDAVVELKSKRKIVFEISEPESLGK